MSAVFAAVLNMSLTASIIILLVLLARRCLNKAPKIYSYLLWSVVLFRLLCPFSITAPVSLLSMFSNASTGTSADGGASYTASMNYIRMTEETQSAQEPAPEEYSEEQNYDYGGETESAGADAEGIADGYYGGHHPQARDADPASAHSGGATALSILAWVWFAGAVAFAAYTVMQYVRLNRQLVYSMRLRDNIYENDEIKTAFVFGLLRVRIYVPVGLSGETLEAVVMHEQTHQRRGDHIVKIIAYFALSLHWFNPLVWLAFRLACDDMEKSCDEVVLNAIENDKAVGTGSRVSYASMLLMLAGGQNYFMSPVSFAETGIKNRINNVLGYRRLSKGMTVAVSLLVILAIAVSMVNPMVAYAVIEEAWKANTSHVYAWTDDTWTGNTPAQSQEETHYSSTEIVEIYTADDVNKLSGLEATEELYVNFRASVGSVDLSALAGFDNLKSLHLDASSYWTGEEYCNPYVTYTLPAMESLRSLDIKNEDSEYYELPDYQGYSKARPERNFEFLHGLKHVEELSINGTAIDSVAVFSDLPELKKLYLSGCMFSRSGLVENSSNLEYLYFWFNYILEDDRIIENELKLSEMGSLLENTDCLEVTVSCEEDKDTIIGMKNVQKLSFLQDGEVLFDDNGNITDYISPDLSWLAQAQQIKELRSNYFEYYYDLSPIGSMTQLEKLLLEIIPGDGSETYLPDLSSFENLNNLKELTLNYCWHGDAEYGADADVSELSFISKLTQLEKLRIYMNVDSLPDMSALTNLKELYVIDDTLTDVSGISELTDLTYNADAEWNGLWRPFDESYFFLT